MTPWEIALELKVRIQGEIDHFGGNLPERFAIAWRAYLAGLLEWNVIDTPEYDELITLVPSVDDDPAVAILRGRD